MEDEGRDNATPPLPWPNDTLEVFDPPQPSAVTDAYLFIGAFGFTLNLFVLVVLVSYKQSRQNLSNVYIFFQCGVDASVALFLFLTTVFSDHGGPYSSESVFDQLMCRLWHSHTCMWSMLVVSNYMVVALAFERYVAVVHPIYHRTKFSKRKIYTVLTIGFAHLTGFYDLTISVSTSGIFEGGKCYLIYMWSGEKTATYVGMLTVVVEYFVPLIVIIVLYSKIAWALHMRVAPGPPDGGEPQATSEQGGKSKAKSLLHARDNVLRTSVWIAAAFVLCWTMNQIYYFFYNLGAYVVGFNHPFYYVTVVMVLLQCCFNPIIYCAKLESFQKGVRQLIVDRLIAKVTK